MIDEPAALPNLAELTSMVVDFALFRRYISPAVLVGIYYAGAIAMPVVLSIGYRMILHGRYSPTTAIAPLFDLLRESAGGSRVRLGVAIALLLLLAETGWRMAAEFMVVYFEIAGRLEHACGGC
ncbi:MAG: DUF4282 domain-containing protein [Gammaproteobacteria bacterium]|nr:DUF4282 domain-containing protein [Gammaproteobacteria bacterium]MCP5318165.1 DUF4282 domain-containing protein [Chromatiaceae bacterium]MCP5431502.1 DUF4282 domain-containing protein [Chromatiaceae bacterium]HPQ26183.1 DUF4282 domain-containing protein [Gammaproteobacteria bacterium]